MIQVANSIVMMQRKSTAEITLSSTCTIPSHSYISVPLVHFLRNPNIYPNPTQFDPYRFLHLRKRPGEETSHRFVSINNRFFAFGLGAHVCSRRFFVGNEIKIILAILLITYDFQCLQTQASKVTRPSNLCFEQQNAPCLIQKINFRKRSLIV